MIDSSAAPTWLTTEAMLDKLGGQAAFLRDPGQALCRLAEGADDAVGADAGGRRILLVVAPDLVRQLLIAWAGETTKGPGLQAVRAFLGNGLLTSEGEQH